MTGTTKMTISREHAQTALSMLNCSHPDGSVSESPQECACAPRPRQRADAKVIKQAIDRLEELAEEVAKVEYMLADVNFSFGKLEV